MPRKHFYPILMNSKFKVLSLKLKGEQNKLPHGLSPQAQSLVNENLHDSGKSVFLSSENSPKITRHEIFRTRKKLFDHRAEITCSMYVNNIKFEYNENCLLKKRPTSCVMLSLVALTRPICDP